MGSLTVSLNTKVRKVSVSDWLAVPVTFSRTDFTKQNRISCVKGTLFINTSVKSGDRQSSEFLLENLNAASLGMKVSGLKQPSWGGGLVEGSRAAGA